jgi:hypothetical protein
VRGSGHDLPGAFIHRRLQRNPGVELLIEDGDELRARITLSTDREADLGPG